MRDAQVAKGPTFDHCACRLLTVIDDNVHGAWQQAVALRRGCVSRVALEQLYALTTAERADHLTRRVLHSNIDAEDTRFGPKIVVPHPQRPSEVHTDLRHVSDAIRAAVCCAAEPYKLVVLVQEKLLSKELEVVAVPFASAILISWRVQVMAQTNCA